MVPGAKHKQRLARARLSCCDSLAASPCRSPPLHGTATVTTALSEVAREAVAQAAAAQPDLPVTRVGVTGQMHGVVRWQAPSGGVGPPRACSSLATWEDRRCAPAFVQRCNRLAGATAQAWPLASGYGCTTLAWYAHHEPAELDRFDRVGTVMVSRGVVPTARHGLRLVLTLRCVAGLRDRTGDRGRR